MENVKRIKTFIAKDGQLYEGGYEDFLRKIVDVGGAGQTDSLPKGTSEPEVKN